MTQRDYILQELKELQSSLVTISSSNLYYVPGNYFEELAGEIMARIKAMESESTREELSASSLLIHIKRTMPYQAPAGYFDSLEEKLMQGVLQSEQNLSAAEELESLSPLLSSLKKEVPYSVPADYFQSLNETSSKAVEPAKAKVISLTNRKWFRYASAAIVTGFIALGGFVFLGNNKSIDIDENPHGWVESNVKKVSTDELNDFIDLTDEAAPVIASNSGNDDVKELMKNVSDEAIQDFLNETQPAESDSDNDPLLN